MSDENVENHTLVLLREIRDRLDRIEGTQAEFRAMLAERTAMPAPLGGTLASSPKTFAANELMKALTAVIANQQRRAQMLNELLPASTRWTAGSASSKGALASSPSSPPSAVQTHFTPSNFGLL